VKLTRVLEYIGSEERIKQTLANSAIKGELDCGNHLIIREVSITVNAEENKKEKN
jgi:hypothetical protein